MRSKTIAVSNTAVSRTRGWQREARKWGAERHRKGRASPPRLVLHKALFGLRVDFSGVMFAEVIFMEEETEAQSLSSMSEVLYSD